MKQERVKIKLPEGTFDVRANIFENKDITFLAKIYDDWRNLTNRLKNIGGRGINLPEVLSEAIFCLNMGAIRINSNINGANSSFDVFEPTRNKRIQIKACSVLPDLTSFGPESVWDELYFLDFYRKGEWDGTIDCYIIPNNSIYNFRVNSNSTLKEQQKLGRRPRFSIYKGIILRDNIKPLKTFRLK